jgi:glycosyltransferase involved in cell wall biosynthesis
MCTYNGAAFLEQQLCSIAAQSRPVQEIVICDDGSTDATVEIIDAFSRQHPGVVRLYRNAVRLGYSQNFAQALALCQGDVIFFSDHDDVWLPSKVEKMAALFTNDPHCGLVSAAAIITNRDLAPTGKTLSAWSESAQKYAQTFSARIQQSFARGCTLALRASLRPVILPISPHWGHDNWICFIAPIFMETKAVQEPMMFYRRHSASSGLNEKVDMSPSQELLSAFKKSTTLDYHRDREQWQAMFDHLQRILDVGFIANFDNGILMSQPDILKRQALILNDVSARLEFSKKRSRMTAKPRALRIVPALGMLLSGHYGNFVSGRRSFMKDLLTP